MYDTSIPTLAYVFISLTSLVITYSHIMSNQDEATNQDGMPEFVDKEIMDEDMIQVDEPEKIEEVVAPVEVNAVNNVAEQKELLNPQAAPPQMNPPAQENPVNLIPANQEEKPEAVQEENKNQGGKKKKTKKKSKKQKQSRRTLRNKKQSKKANKNTEKKKKIHVMKGGSDPDPDSDSDYSVDSSDFTEEAYREFKRYGYSILYPGHHAAKSGDKDGVVKYIRTGKAPIERIVPVKDDNGNNTGQWIVSRIRTDLGLGDDESRVNSLDDIGESMLYIAIENKKPKLVYYLLNGLKADYFEQSINGSSIFELTAIRPSMFTNDIHNMIIDRALKDGNINNEQHSQYIREGPVLGEFYDEPEPDDYLSD